jgi:hypothetical protein
MNITSEEYQVFYKILCKSVAHKYYKGNKKKYYSEDSPQLWDSYDEGDFVEDLGGPKAQSIRYFYRKASLLNPETTRKGKVDDDAFLKGLEYIGLELPMESSKKPMTRGKKLRILFQIFRETFAKDIELLGSDNPPIEPEPPNNDNKSFNTASNTIKHYFKLLSEKKLQEAWQLLSPTFKRRHFRDNLEHFTDLHNAVSNFEVLWTFEHEQIRDIVELKAVLKYKALTIPGVGLAMFSLWPVSNIEKFYQLAKQLRASMRRDGMKGFDNVRIGQLFEDTATIQIAKMSDVSFRTMKAVFQKHEFIEKYAIYRCAVMVTGKNMDSSILPLSHGTYKEDELYM